MLISHVAMRVTRMPFNNKQELHDSGYKFATRPGSSAWASFKYGNSLWQNIYKDKLEPYEEEYISVVKKRIRIEWLLGNERRAFYAPYLAFS